MSSPIVNDLPLKVAEIELKYITKVNPADRIQIKSSQDAFEIFYQGWNKDSIEHIEEFKLILLNRSNKVLGLVNLSKGSTVGSVVDIKVILQYVLKANASSIIVTHNHPSGNREPSDADRKITERLKQACSLFDIALLDHLIITPCEEYLSFSDEGIM